MTSLRCKSEGYFASKLPEKLLKKDLSNAVGIQEGSLSLRSSAPSF